MASSGSANLERPPTAAGRQRMPKTSDKQMPRTSDKQKRAMSNECVDNVASFEEGGSADMLQNLSKTNKKVKGRTQTFQHTTYAYTPGNVNVSTTKPRPRAEQQQSRKSQRRRHKPTPSTPLENLQQEQREQQYADVRVPAVKPAHRPKYLPPTTTGNSKKRTNHQQAKNTINVDGDDESSITNVHEDSQTPAKGGSNSLSDFRKKRRSSGTPAVSRPVDAPRPILGHKYNSSQLDDSDADLTPARARIVKRDVSDDTHKDGSMARYLVENIQSNDHPTAFAQKAKSINQNIGDVSTQKMVTKNPSRFNSFRTSLPTPSLSASRSTRNTRSTASKIVPGKSLWERTSLFLRESTKPPPHPAAMTGKRKQTASKEKEEKAEVIDLLEDDDDEIEESGAPKSAWDAPCVYQFPRISIGPTVFRNQCYAAIVNSTIELRFARVKEGRTRRSSLQAENCELDLEIHDLKQFSYHSVGEEPPPDHKSFVALTVDKYAHEHVQKYCPEYNAAADEQIFRFIVLEFDSPSRLEQFCDQLRSLPGDPWDISQKIEIGAITSAEEASQMCVALTTDYESHESNPRKNKKRKSLEIWDEPAYLKGRADEDVLLVYPFAGSKSEMEKAAFGPFAFFRPKANVKLDEASSAELVSEEEESSNGRSHYLTVTAGDCRRLEPGVYLNDTLIDFFMQWMHRNEPEDSPLHYFTTHFYTQLAEKGPEGVRRWTEKKGIDIFAKRLIFVPINKVLHWSLAVIINPGAIQIDLEGEQQCAPLIVFFDSLSMHKKVVVGKKLRAWLNAEWKRQKGPSDDDNGGPFTKDSIETFSPRAPRQQNGYDCGVFVCRNAFGMTQLKEHTFSVAEIGNRESRETFFNHDMKHAFEYTNEDIDNVRKELLDFLGKLSSLYLPWNAEQKKIKAERKRAKKKSEDNGVDKTSESDSQSPDSRLLSPESSTVEIIEQRTLVPKAFSTTGEENNVTSDSEDEKTSPEGGMNKVLNRLKRSHGKLWPTPSKTNSEKKSGKSASALNLTKVNHRKQPPPASSNGGSKGTASSLENLEDSDDNGAGSNQQKRDEIDLTSQVSGNSESSRVVAPHDTLMDVAGMAAETEQMQSKIDRRRSSKRTNQHPGYHDVKEVETPKKTLLTRRERPRRSAKGDSLSEPQALVESDDDSTEQDDKASPTEKESDEMSVDVVGKSEPDSSSVASVTNSMKQLCDDAQFYSV